MHRFMRISSYWHYSDKTILKQSYPILIGILQDAFHITLSLYSDNIIEHNKEQAFAHKCTHKEKTERLILESGMNYTFLTDFL